MPAIPMAGPGSPVAERDSDEGRTQIMQIPTPLYFVCVAGYQLKLFLAHFYHVGHLQERFTPANKLRLMSAPQTATEIGVKGEHFTFFFCVLCHGRIEV